MDHSMIDQATCEHRPAHVQSNFWKTVYCTKCGVEIRLTERNEFLSVLPTFAAILANAVLCMIRYITGDRLLVPLSTAFCIIIGCWCVLDFATTLIVHNKGHYEKVQHVRRERVNKICILVSLGLFLLAICLGFILLQELTYLWLFIAFSLLMIVAFLRQSAWSFVRPVNALKSAASAINGILVLSFLTGSYLLLVFLALEAGVFLVCRYLARR